MNLENTHLLLNQARIIIKILYCVLNYSSILQMKYYLLLYTEIIRPLLTHIHTGIYLGWTDTSPKKIKLSKINTSEINNKRHLI